MHLSKETGSSFLRFKGRCNITGAGPPLYPTRWHIRGSWQLFKCLRWQPTEDDNRPCERKTQVCHLIGGVMKGRQSAAAPLANDLRKSDHLKLSISHFWPFQMLSKKQPWQWPLTLEKKHGVSTNWPNIATKFARRGTMRSLLPSNWSSWHRAASAMQWTEFHSNYQSPTSPGESCARLPAGLRPHRHPWCHRQSTWSAQERTVWIYSPPRRWHIKKGTFMTSKPQSSKNLAFVGGLFPYYQLDGAKCRIYLKPQKS